MSRKYCPCLYSILWKFDKTSWAYSISFLHVYFFMRINIFLWRFWWHFPFFPLSFIRRSNFTFILEFFFRDRNPSNIVFYIITVSYLRMSHGNGGSGLGVGGVSSSSVLLLHGILALLAPLHLAAGSNSRHRLLILVKLRVVPDIRPFLISGIQLAKVKNSFDIKLCQYITVSRFVDN